MLQYTFSAPTVIPAVTFQQADEKPKASTATHVLTWGAIIGAITLLGFAIYRQSTMDPELKARIKFHRRARKRGIY